MKSKKTIIYIGGFELPDKNAAAQRVLANAKIFRELGFHVVFIGADKSLSRDIHVKDTKSFVQGFDSWSIPYPQGKKQWLKHITSSDYIKYIADKYYADDVYAIIGYNYPAIAQYKIQKYCQDRGMFFIADATEWHESSGGGILFNTIKWLDTSLRMRIVHAKADGIISISRYLTNFYNKKNCITMEVPTLFDVESFREITEVARAEKKVKLMYAGISFNLNRVNKNRTNIKDRLDKIVSMLYKVHQQQTNFILDIYGLEKKNYLAVFPEHHDMLDELSQCIAFHGRKPHQEIVNNIRNSDFTIFIRNIDRVVEAGFPTKFSESISYGTPVISNMISNIEDYAVEGGSSYIISLDDEKKQVEKMVEILNLSTKKRHAMKKYCLKNKIFDYHEYIESVKEFLYKVEQNQRDK